MKVLLLGGGNDRDRCQERAMSDVLAQAQLRVLSISNVHSICLFIYSHFAKFSTIFHTLFVNFLTFSSLVLTADESLHIKTPEMQDIDFFIELSHLQQLMQPNS